MYNTQITNWWKFLISFVKFCWLKELMEILCGVVFCSNYFMQIWRGLVFFLEILILYALNVFTWFSYSNCCTCLWISFLHKVVTSYWHSLFYNKSHFQITVIIQRCLIFNSVAIQNVWSRIPWLFRSDLFFLTPFHRWEFLSTLGRPLRTRNLLASHEDVKLLGWE